MTTQAGGVPAERSDEQRWVIYCPLNRPAKPLCFLGLEMIFLSRNTDCKLDVKQQIGIKTFI